jgi:hypothetical protein
MTYERNSYGSRCNELMIFMMHELCRVEKDFVVLALDLSLEFELTTEWTGSLTQWNCRC